MLGQTGDRKVLSWGDSCSEQSYVQRWLKSTLPILLFVLLSACTYKPLYKVNPDVAWMFLCYDNGKANSLVIISYGVLQVNDSIYTIYNLKYNEQYLIAEVYDSDSDWWRIHTDYHVLKYQMLSEDTPWDRPVWRTVKYLAVIDRIKLDL